MTKQADLKSNVQWKCFSYFPPQCISLISITWYVPPKYLSVCNICYFLMFIFMVALFVLVNTVKITWTKFTYLKLSKMSWFFINEKIIFLIQYSNYSFKSSFKSSHQILVSIIIFKLFLPYNINLVCLYK